ncbi:MAG: methyltransferase domain-containing protein [Pseudomonadota bacterium]
MLNTSLDRALATAKSKARAGATDEARQIYQSVLTKFPSNKRARRGLQALPAPVVTDAPEAELRQFMLLFENARYDQAVQLGERMVQRYPSDAMVRNLLGACFGETGQLDRAASCFFEAVRLDPRDAEAHYNLAQILPSLGRPGEALTCLVKALELSPEQREYWRSFAGLLQTITFKGYHENFAALFLKLLRQRDVCEPIYVLRPIIRLLKHHEAIKRASAAVEKDGNRALNLNTIIALSEIPLLSEILRLCIIPDPELEKVLTIARGGLLRHRGDKRFSAVSPQFQNALALHCHLNEYVWATTHEEREKLQDLEQELETGPRPFAALACLASYRSLADYSWRADLAQDANCREIFSVQVKASDVEAHIRQELEELTPIEDETSQAVQEQYEENPYPRWVSMVPNEAALSVTDYLSALGIPKTDAKPLPGTSPDVLVAGCGTGQQAIDVATRFSGARVLAVDLSRSSLAYAKRKTDELGLSNIEYKHADILRLDCLDQQFDVIESVGVLHHMAEPLDGWKILAGRLKPDGVMKIGLYSALARREIVAAREVISQLGLGGTKDDIRMFRQALMRGELEDHDELARLTKVDDFYSTSECRDMLFHVQEHRFTLQKVQAALETLGLDFLGFDLPTALKEGPKAHTLPPQGSLEALNAWDAFEQENPDTFIRMYQFWVRKAGA